MDQLILVRHGEAEHHVADITGGWTDLPLTRLGQAQADSVGQEIQSLLRGGEAALYCSDLLRARQTAERIGERLRLQVMAEPGLRELDNGIARGKTREEAQSLLLPMTAPTIDWVPYPGAESWRALNGRVVKCMQGIQARDTKNIVIVSHANSLVCIVHWWLGIPEDMMSRISYDFLPASITRLTVNSFGEKTISLLSSTGHLGRDERGDR